jgi:hypothetical protein
VRMGRAPDGTVKLDGAERQAWCVRERRNNVRARVISLPRRDDWARE